MSGGDDSGGPFAERRCGLNEGRVTALEPRSGANTSPSRWRSSPPRFSLPPSARH